MEVLKNAEKKQYFDDCMQARQRERGREGERE